MLNYVVGCALFDIHSCAGFIIRLAMPHLFTFAGRFLRSTADNQDAKTFVGPRIDASFFDDRHPHLSAVKYIVQANHHICESGHQSIDRGSSCTCNTTPHIRSFTLSRFSLAVKRDVALSYCGGNPSTIPQSRPSQAHLRRPSLPSHADTIAYCVGVV